MSEGQVDGIDVMNNIYNFAELLYLISNFEKGRVKSSGIWGRKYVNSFKKSLDIMSLLLNLMSRTRKITQDDIHILKHFMQKNDGVIFNCDYKESSLVFDNNDLDYTSKEYRNVINMMNEIIFEINNLLCTRPTNYKLKISYLLRALHNLPRVFLNPNYSKISISPIAPSEALEAANSYLRLKENIS